MHRALQSFGLLLLLLSTRLAGAVDPTVIPARLLFVEDAFHSFLISPDGRYIAGQFFSNGNFEIDLFRSRDMTTRNVMRLRQFESASIDRYFWIDKDSLVVRYRNASGEPANLLLDIAEEDGELSVSKHDVTSRGFVVDPLPNEDDKVLYAYVEGLKNLSTDLRLSTMSCLDLTRCQGEKSLNGGMSQAFFFLTDLQHRVSMAAEEEDDWVSFYYRAPDSKIWKRFLRFNLEQGSFMPQGFVDLHRIAAISSLERDRRALVIFNLQTNRIEQTILQIERGEVLSADLDPTSGQILTARLIADGRIGTSYLTPTLHADKEKFARAFPGKDTFIVSQSVDRRYVLLLADRIGRPWRDILLRSGCEPRPTDHGCAAKSS